MNTIKNFFNYLKGFKKLKVKTVIGNIAVLVDQKDRFVGIVSSSIVVDKDVVWGKVSSSTKKIEVVSHASYKSSRAVYLVEQDKSGKYWGRNRYNDEICLVNDCYNASVGHYIAANVVEYRQIPWVSVLFDDDDDELL